MARHNATQAVPFVAYHFTLGDIAPPEMQWHSGSAFSFGIGDPGSIRNMWFALCFLPLRIQSVTLDKRDLSMVGYQIYGANYPETCH